MAIFRPFSSGFGQIADTTCEYRLIAKPGSARE
jgi:hypothetical protein